MIYRDLGKTGMRLSAIGFGASSLGGVFHDFEEAKGIEAVFAAIDAGVNFIDVSPYYGYYKAETVLGKALKDIPRDKFFLSTKVGRYGEDGHNIWDYSAERVTRSVYESMERLNIDYIDLINVHDIEFSDLDQVAGETLPALVRLREQGVVKHEVARAERKCAIRGLRVVQQRHPAPNLHRPGDPQRLGESPNPVSAQFEAAVGLHSVKRDEWIVEIAVAGRGIGATVYRNDAAARAYAVSVDGVFRTELVTA